MHKVYELRDKLLKELEEYGSKEKLDLSTVDIVDKLAHAIKNLNKIIENCEEEGYSQTGMMRNSYDSDNRMYPDYRGGSYGRRGYRYSRAEAEVDSMITDLQDMMRDLPPEKQHEAKKFIQRMEMMR